MYPPKLDLLIKGEQTTFPRGYVQREDTEKKDKERADSSIDWKFVPT